MDRLILASASPRRKEILTRLGFNFEVKPQDTDEAFSGLSPAEEAVKIASEKAAACVSAEGPGRWVLGADTFVLSGNEYMIKPENRTDAKRMITKLSGSTHTVVTGLALNVPNHEGAGSIDTAVCLTEVTFAPMSPDEIEWYLDTLEWQGVAAAYRIQEKGALFIESISGSYSNVMGLPINTFYGMLRSNNFNFRN